VLDGYATAMELRNRGYEQPIIAVTAHAMEDDEGKCLACGCDGYLSKPLERERLIACIAHFTQGVAPAELATRRARRMRRATVARVRVLVVDDDISNCAALERLLRSAGYEVETATTGLAALGARGRFDVVLLDLSLPDMAAAEVVARLGARRELERCRLVCLSGRSPTECDWRSLGFHAFVQKPAGIEELKPILWPRADSGARD
jgi:two-component system CheB/CheR fusion protein